MRLFALTTVLAACWCLASNVAQGEEPAWRKLGPEELARRGYPHEVPLAEAVEEFNARASHDPIGRKQGALTVDEVVAAIRAWDPEQEPAQDRDAVEKIKGIAKTRMMPKGSFIRFIPGLAAYEGYDIDLWWIDLLIGLERNPPGEGEWDTELTFPSRRIRTRFIAARPHHD